MSEQVSVSSQAQHVSTDPRTAHYRPPYIGRAEDRQEVQSAVAA